MWKLSEIESESTYVLELCHDAGGRRHLQLRAPDREPRHPDAIFETETVSHELLKFRSAERIAETVRLSDGRAFEVDAHGIWFTPEELDALEQSDGDLDAVEWCTATPPTIAPC